MVDTDLEGGFFCRDLDDNALTGTIPTTVGMLTSLGYLYASHQPPPCVSR
jgi:hypothetical protein